MSDVGWSLRRPGNMPRNSQVGAYTYPAVGQKRPHAPLTVAGQSYSYDANGSLLSGGRRSYSWDGENPHPDMRLKGKGSAPQAAFLHRDHLASVRAIADESTMVVRRLSTGPGAASADASE